MGNNNINSLSDERLTQTQRLKMIADSIAMTRKKTIEQQPSLDEDPPSAFMEFHDITARVTPVSQSEEDTKTDPGIAHPLPPFN